MPKVPQSLTPDLHTVALGFYLNWYLRPRSSPAGSSLGLLASLSAWVSSSKSAMVDSAVSSMALATYSRVRHHILAATASSMTYQLTLRSAQNSISNLSAANIDACLMTIFLMSRYEDVFHRHWHSPTGISFGSAPHHDGATVILKTWVDKFRDSNPPSTVIKYTRRGLLRSALLRHLAVPEWMVDGSVFGETGQDLAYDSIFVRLLNLRHQLQTGLGNDDSGVTNSYVIPSASDLEDLLAELKTLDGDLETWKANFPTSWEFTTWTVKDVGQTPRQHFYTPRANFHSSLVAVAAHNHYLITRMLVSSTRMRLVQQSQFFPETFRDGIDKEMLKCLFHLEDMGKEVAANFPFCLSLIKLEDGECVIRKTGSMEAYEPATANLLAWPLSVVSCLHGVNNAQMKWFQSELIFVGITLGIGALQCTDGHACIRL
ncbi:hypothetical protein B0A52_07876 [Exophiala mesophila]|uniref:Transcription factor domain-containing protein n=1 Tax=Exophiala mesophila TaxID=212818 RepID=A0A438MVG7_EXOME|nr:hypothetical protein B0A52_07876 [Exophiala mesophila]